MKKKLYFVYRRQLNLQTISDSEGFVGTYFTITNEIVLICLRNYEIEIYIQKKIYLQIFIFIQNLFCSDWMNQKRAATTHLFRL